MKSSCNSTLIPQINENITKAEWKTKEEIPKLLENAYKNLKLIFDIIDWNYLLFFTAFGTNNE